LMSIMFRNSSQNAIFRNLSLFFEYRRQKNAISGQGETCRSGIRLLAFV